MAEAEARTTVRLSRELHKRLRIMAAMDELSINDFLQQLITRESEKRDVDKMVKAS